MENKKIECKVLRTKINDFFHKNREMLGPEGGV
jgi:hypothetical protein